VMARTGDNLMKYLFLITALILMTPLAFAQNYQIDWWVIGSGGGHSESGSYQLDGTIGQPIVGNSLSANYILEAGFWVGAGEAGGGCLYVPGDINGNGFANGIDVTYGVSYLKGGSAPRDSCDCPPLAFPFYAAMDVNGNCAANGIDITFYVAYLKGQQPSLLYCSSCPPGRLTAPPAPAVMPVSSPILKSRGILRSGE